MIINLLCIETESFNFGSTVGLIGGIVGIIASLWTFYDRFKNRKPKIKVFAPYQWNANDTITGQLTLFIFFRFSNISQTPTYLYLETLKTEIYYSDSQKWESIQNIKLLTDKVQTDFSEAKKNEFGIEKAKYLNVFDDCFVKYSEPLCGYLLFQIRSDKYTKLKGEIIDSRHKKIDFEIDFAKQKKLDPHTR
jgi:hypothetical protein